MNQPTVSILLAGLVFSAAAASAPLELTGAQINIKGGKTFTINGATGAGGKSEQHFRWDENSESFVRTGGKNEAYCATKPFRDSIRSDGVFTISIASCG